MEIGREGDGCETDSTRIRVAFEEDRRSDKNRRQRRTGGRNIEKRKVVVRLVYGVRKVEYEGPGLGVRGVGARGMGI